MQLDGQNDISFQMMFQQPPRSLFHNPVQVRDQLVVPGEADPRTNLGQRPGPASFHQPPLIPSGQGPFHAHDGSWQRQEQERYCRSPLLGQPPAPGFSGVYPELSAMSQEVLALAPDFGSQVWRETQPQLNWSSHLDPSSWTLEPHRSEEPCPDQMDPALVDGFPHGASLTLANIAKSARIHTSPSYPYSVQMETPLATPGYTKSDDGSPQGVPMPESTGMGSVPFAGSPLQPMGCPLLAEGNPERISIVDDPHGVSFDSMPPRVWASDARAHCTSR